MHSNMYLLYNIIWYSNAFKNHFKEIARTTLHEKIRAIYIGDVRFDQCPVFELNTKTNYFEMLIDKEFRYEKEVVEEDDEFLVFVVENDIATFIKE